MIIVFIFILGLFIGSFLNVLADRLPKDESVVKGRSYCDKCKKTLQWYDLIPLLSFLILKGKCRYCSVSLSFYYPIVELLTGLMFVVTFLFVVNNFQSGQVLTLIYHLFIVSSLIVIFFADLKYGIIPDKVIFPTMVITFSYLFINNSSLIINHLFSALGAFLFFLILFLITKGRGMGFGDVKFAFLMGLILGFPSIVISLYIAFLTGAIVGCILIIWRRKKIFGTAIPFGPFLVFGTLSAIFLGEKILQILKQVLL